MNSDLIVDVSPSEIVIALQEDKKLVELTTVQSGAKFAVGDIYLGKVKKIMPSLNAAFIDVGYSKDAFLHYLDLGQQFLTLNKYLQLAISKKSKKPSMARMQSEKDIPKDGKISDVLKAGQKILVQITKEPISTKGPRLTSEISIAGRHMVLMPFSDKISVSQRINTADEKARLKKLLESIKPKKYGVIIRTAAENVKVAELDQELRGLVNKWESITSTTLRSNPPALVLGEMGRTTSILRDIYTPDFNSIIVNDQTEYDEIKDYLENIQPDKVNTVKLYKGKQPLFEHYSIDKQIKSAFGKTVTFKDGAYLIIEHTEAFHVIDINSGNRVKKNINQETNALEVNLAACDEIAHQLRLRDMGGIIVIDFIDMNKAENRKKVYDHMKEVMSADRTRHNILPLSKFCLMQITRQRVRPVVDIDTSEVCPCCSGTGKVAPTILLADELDEKIEYIYKELKKKKLILRVHPYLAAYLTKGRNSLKTKWFLKNFKWIRVEAINSYQFLEYHFFDENMEEIVL